MDAQGPEAADVEIELPDDLMRELVGDPDDVADDPAQDAPDDPGQGI